MADLTLVAVAAARQQLAASIGEAPAQAPAPAGQTGRASRRDQPARSIESEHAEIELIARSVIEELQRVRSLARERSGEEWES